MGNKKEENEAATAMEDDEVMKLDKNGTHRTSVVAGETSHVHVSHNFADCAVNTEQYLEVHKWNIDKIREINIINSYFSRTHSVL